MDVIMLGVVLWSDASDRKAVIWCEDQGDLAYVKPEVDKCSQEDFFDAGDLVQFDMNTQSSMRIAQNPRLVIEKAGQALPGFLLNGVDPAAEAQAPTAQVIPFHPPETRLLNRA